MPATLFATLCIAGIATLAPDPHALATEFTKEPKVFETLILLLDRQKKQNVRDIERREGGMHKASEKLYHVSTVLGGK